MQNRIYSIDSAKALKAQSFGYLNGIHYMAPHRAAGVGDLCGNASPGCINLCLGVYSGQAGIISDANDHDMEGNAARKSRVQKARRFMQERAAYMCDLIRSTQLLVARAERMGMIPVARPNGATDIAWELIRIRAVWAIEFPFLLPFVGKSLMEIFPDVQFVDYTKNPRRFDKPLPANYSVTFSRSELNHAACVELLAKGVNVAICFAGELPESWNGYPVIDGDKHDLRMLDPKGCVIGLAPKGRKAKRDESGFVVRDHGAILS